LRFFTFKAGMSAPELRQKLSQILPRTVDGNDAGGMIPNA
jgi:hypothetical protein